jgi:hypothetical protein
MSVNDMRDGGLDNLKDGNKALPGENAAPAGSPEAIAAELASLRHQVVAQAAELATIRWNMNALLNQQRILSYAAGAKGYVKRWFPGYIEKVKQARRDVKSLFSSVRRSRAMAAADVGDIDIASGLRLRTPVLVADDSSAGRRIAAETGSRHLIKVTPGAGWTRTLPVAPDGEPTLRLPAGGSLVDWMVTESRHLRRVGAIVIDANDDVSLGLMRGRLAAGQQLVLTPRRLRSRPSSERRNFKAAISPSTSAFPLPGWTLWRKAGNPFPRSPAPGNGPGFPLSW